MENKQIKITLIFGLYSTLELYFLELKEIHSHQNKKLINNILFNLKLIRNGAYKLIKEKKDIDNYEENLGEIYEQFTKLEISTQLKIYYGYQIILMLDKELNDLLFQKTKLYYLNEIMISTNKNIEKLYQKIILEEKKIEIGLIKEKMLNIF